MEPFGWIEEKYQGRVFAVLAIFSLLLSVYFATFMNSLRSAAVPQGVISFEFARTAAEATAILNHWSATDKTRILFHLGLDYLYLFVYGLSFSLGICLLRRKMTGFLHKLGGFLCWFALLAIPMDAIENYALLLHILKRPTDLQATISVTCATIKFTTVFASLAYLLGGLLILPFRKKT